jgi:hypothetical protein
MTEFRKSAYNLAVDPHGIRQLPRRGAPIKQRERWASLVWTVSPSSWLSMGLARDQTPWASG